MEFCTWQPQDLNRDKPLYLAIADALEGDIRSGLLATGQKLPPQRDLADLIGVNLSTITRALNECQHRGLISGTVGSGTFVSSDANVAVSMFDPETFSSDLLEMGLVYPLYELDEEIAAHISSILQDTDLSALMRYVEPAGLLRHREAGSAWLNRFGLGTAPRNILISSGSQNALACCLMSLFKTGDHIAVDALTYPSIKTLASMLGIRLVPIRMDKGGMNPEALANACRREPIRGIYLMPEVQNPTTAFIPDDRREQLAALIRKYDLVLLEDDAFRFTGRLEHEAMTGLVPDSGVYIAGISKILGAGVRISFIAVPERLKGQLEMAILNTSWMASPINAEIVCRLLTNGAGEAIMQKKRAEAGRRTALALQKLSSFTVFSRNNGFYLWMLLPRGWATGREFELTASAAGVKVFCAEKFAVGSGPVPAAIRISLTGTETMEELEKGLDILTGILSGTCRLPEIVF